MATSVTSYNVGLTLDANDYINKSRLSRQETAKLQREINSARSPMENFARTYDRLEKALANNAISLGTYQRLLEAARIKRDKATAAEERAIAATNKAAASQHRLNSEVITASVVNDRNAAAVTRQSAGVGLLAARYLSLYAAASIVRRAIVLDAELQSNSAAFEVFTGSVESSNKMLAEMRALAERTPLSFRGVADSAKTLMAFNVPANQVMVTLERLGNVTGGNAERFKMLSLAYAQSSAAGHLMGQDLLQMINAGFNPLQEISRKTGRSLIDLKADMEKGAISFAMVEEAFKTATEEGGRFNGMMDKIGQTSAGALARAQSKMDVLLADLGNELAPITLDVVAGFEEMSPALQEASKNIGVMVEGLSAMLGLVNQLKDALDFGDSKFGTIATSAPITNLRSAVDYITGHLTGSVEKLVEVRERLGRGVFSESVNKDMDEFISKQKEAKDAIDAVNNAIPDPGAVVGGVDAAASKESEAIEKRIAALQRELDIIENIGVAEDRRRLIEDGLTQAQAGQVLMLNAWIDEAKKAAEERKKQEADALAAVEKEKEARKAMAKTALANAKKYFEEERKRQLRMQEDMVSKFKSVEVGSAEDVRMQAEQMNRMNAPAMDGKQPTDEMILDEARQQLVELRKQSKADEIQSAKFDKMIALLQDPPIQRRR
jgi:tape measure domain-containing protein